MPEKDFLDKHIETLFPGEGDKDKGRPSVKNYVANDDQKHVYMGDMINQSIATGNSPLSSKEGRLMFQYAKDLYGDKVATNLLDQVIIFNQRVDQKGKSSEDKIQSFYSLIHDPELEKLKNRIDKIGYGPVSQFHNTPNADIQQAQGNDLLKDTADR